MTTDWASIYFITKPATLTVAAYDSHHSSMANLSCDGIDDQDHIMEAIDALSPGGSIQLMEGSFFISADIIWNKAGILRGQGMGATKLIRASGASITNGIISNSVTNTIKDLQVDAQGSEEPCIYINGADSQVIACKVGNQGKTSLNGGLVVGSSGDRSIIDRCQVYKCRGGIYLWRCPGVRVLNCNLWDIRVGLWINDPDGPYIITGNDIHGDGVYAMGMDGIWVDTNAPDGVIVKGNRIYGMGEHGIYAPGDCCNWIVEGNTIVSVGRYGIHLNGNNQSGHIVADNQIIRPAGNGIYMSGVANSRVHHNTILNSGQNAGLTNEERAGIRVAELCDDNFVEDNNIVDTQGAHTMTYGIFLRGYAFVPPLTSNRNQVRNNLIKGNTIAGSEGGGIHITGPVYDTVLTEPVCEIFHDVLAEAANHIVAAEVLTAATPITCTLAAQPDVPRNITITITDGDTSITAFEITVLGVDAKGGVESEVFVFAGGLVQVGNVAFSRITSVTVNSIVGAGVGDVLDVGIGSKLGLSGIFRIAADVYKIKKNAADWPAASYTPNATYFTVDVSTGGAIGGGDDFTVWFRSNLNALA